MLATGRVCGGGGGSWEVGGSESGDGGGRLRFVSWSLAAVVWPDGTTDQYYAGPRGEGLEDTAWLEERVVRIRSCVRCARAIPRAEGWISGWDGVARWDGRVSCSFFPESLHGRHHWRPGLCPASRGARSTAALARRSHSPISAVSLETPHVFVPDPKIFSVADVIGHQTLGRNAQVALPLNYFRQSKQTGPTTSQQPQNIVKYFATPRFTDSLLRTDF